jgi:hypothetical protein
MIAVQLRFAAAVAAAIVVMALPRVSSAAIQLRATKAEPTALGREHRTERGSSQFSEFTFRGSDDEKAGPGTGQ